MRAKKTARIPRLGSLAIGVVAFMFRSDQSNSEGAFCNIYYTVDIDIVHIINA
jgi:hypothetical protein